MSDTSETEEDVDLLAGRHSTANSRVPYSRYEINRLAALIEEKRKIIENKRTDFNTQGHKNAAWEKLTAEYNSSSDVHQRTVKQLQKKWDNLKMKAKKDVS
jgi:hypothetical protein